MNVFERATEDEIKTLILSSFTSVLKTCPDILITPIADIINFQWQLVHFSKIIKKLM